MIKSKEDCKDDYIGDLSGFYNSSPLFKKYCEMDLCELSLWLRDLEKQKNIKFCEDYINSLFQKHAFKYVNPSLLAVLLQSEYFIKFIKSGFIRYLDFPFLLTFYSDFLCCPLKSKKEMEAFVNAYFKRHIKEFLKKDLLDCETKRINKFFPYSLRVVEGYSSYLEKQVALPSLSDFIVSPVEVSPVDISRPKFTISKKTLRQTLLGKELKKKFVCLIKKKPKLLNKDIQFLFESLELVRDFKMKRISLGCHKTINILFDQNLNFKSGQEKLLLKEFKSPDLKSFDNKFLKNYCVKDFIV